MSNRIVAQVCVPLTALLNCAGTAHAQSATAQPPAVQMPARTDQREDIIVTARKQNESIMKVPVAASAISGKDLDRTCGLL